MNYLEVKHINKKERADEFIGTAIALAAGAVLGTIALVKGAKLAIAGVKRVVTLGKRAWDLSDPKKYAAEKLAAERKKKGFRESCEEILEVKHAIEMTVTVGSTEDGAYRPEDEVRVTGATVADFIHNLKKLTKEHGILSDSAENKIIKELEKALEQQEMNKEKLNA